MILSQACQYGLQATIYLAVQGEAPVLSKEIATQLGIPPHFLAKILQGLSKRGLLKSFKGRGGGFKLSRHPNAITLLDVVRAIEGEDFGTWCLLGLAECSEDVPCPIHSQWKVVKGDILRILGEQSVKDLVDGASGASRWLLPGIPLPTAEPEIAP